MSDQDFFFDEEDEKPARSEKTAAKSSSKSTGGKAPARPSPAKSTTAKSATAKSTTARAPEPEGEGFLFESITIGKGIAVLAVACALLLGMAVGVVVGQSRAQAALTDVPAVSTGQTGSTGGQTAPQLTQDQLNSGQLPAGHPSVGATGSSAATGQ